MVNAVIGGFLTWPLGVWVGRRMTRTQGGVPKVPIQRFVHDFVNVDPTRTARRTFRFWWFSTMAVGGILFAYMTTDDR